MSMQVSTLENITLVIITRFHYPEYCSLLSISLWPWT